ncbi:ATP-dependent 6-phosphofructokinase [bacterium]|nr:ATP-dependent 6-phosphofructokinase [bacterium]
METFDSTIKTLGECVFHSPIQQVKFVSDDDRILDDISEKSFRAAKNGKSEPTFIELAGPRARIYFDPVQTRAAVVTCGGLCPGLNNVIRSIVMSLYYTYGCNDILGIPFGLRGFVSKDHTPFKLTPKDVIDIHEKGGTILASSRGPQDVGAIVDTIENLGIDLVFFIGGDGTLRAALDTWQEVARRGLKRSIIGVPKTIDNDINHLSESFGFESAYAEAVEVIRAAHVEAVGAPNGIGLVKLMGRQSGFVAAHATLGLRDVNFCLIPEIPFELEGEYGFLNALRKRIVKRQHAVIVVAEGAGQSLFGDQELGYDASGNKILGDIGVLLKKKIIDYFKEKGLEVNVRYIDPSYSIRSVPAIPYDAVYCGFLGQMAVHAAMAGKTCMMVGQNKDRFTHIPFEAAISTRKQIEPDGFLWMSILHSTGQPSLINPSKTD